VSLAWADHYATLGIAKQADANQIKKAFRKLSLKYHPDKTKGDAGAQKHFMEISKAYECLSKQDCRSKYDLYGEEGTKGRQVNDPFGMFGNGQQRGQELQAKLEVELAEMYSGGKREVALQLQEICSECRGTGARGGETKTCPHCKGQGKTIVLQQMGFMKIQMQQACQHCRGTGKLAAHGCPTCSGQRIKQNRKQFVIEIERGMKDGEQIRFERGAHQQPGVTPGDLVFILQERKHAQFVRDGQDLDTKITISLLEALNGFDRHIRHLDGHMVRVSSQGVTPHGHVFNIKGEGMPEHGTPSEKGILRVTIVVQFPKQLGDYHMREFAKVL